MSIISEAKAAGIDIFGDTLWRGVCHLEDAELITFINWVEREYPQFPILHVKNEKKRTGKQFKELAGEKKKRSMVKGWPDITIGGFPTLFIEMKRKDVTQSSFESGQVAFLVKAQSADCWAVVALGYQGAQLAFTAWLKENYPNLVKKTCNHKTM